MIRTSSARVAIAIATANGRETPVGAGAGTPDSLPRILHGLACGRVLAAVERCQPHVQDWLIAAYAAEGWPGRGQAAIRAQAMLYMTYTQQRVVRGCTGRLLRLAGLVMADYSHQRLGGEALSPAVYAERVGFDARNWGKWVKAKQLFEDMLDLWDRKGLAEVSAALAWAVGVGPEPAAVQEETTCVAAVLEEVEVMRRLEIGRTPWRRNDGALNRRRPKLGLRKPSEEAA